MTTPPQQPPPASASRHIFKRIFASIRFLILGVILVLTASTIIPAGLFGSTPVLWIAGGILGALFAIAGTVYFISAPKTPGEAALLDLESIAAIVITMLVLFLLGFITLLTVGESRTMTLGVLVMGMFAFYLSRLIRGIFRSHHDNEELRKKYGELLEVDKEKSAFITVTAHQLRTPLTEIKWLIGAALQRSAENQEAVMLLQKGAISVNKLTKIVDDMMKAELVEGSHEEFTVKKSQTDLATLVNDAVGGLEALVRERDVAVRFAPPETPISVAVDKEKMQTVLTTVIDNAIRYSPHKSVEISIAAEGGQVHIRVKDSGIGIDPSEHKRVFQKFFRGKNALLVQPDGSGVGLYVAKHIVEQHGGTIAFFSELDKGSLFIITIPRT